MTSLNKVLGGVLVAQAVLAAITWRPTGSGPVEARDLVGFPSSEVVRVAVTGRMARDEVAEPPVVLAKTDRGWLLESSDGYPATDDNVKTLLESLDKLDAREIIASKADAHVLLEVADDAFTRKLEVESTDGRKATLYLGAGAGQTAHVRVAGEQDVYELNNLSVWSLAEHDNRYFDRDLLRVPPERVQSLVIERPDQPPIRFTSVDGDADGSGAASRKWLVDGTPPDQEVDQDAARNFVQSTLVVRMLEPVGKTVTPEMGLDGGVLVTWVEVDPESGTSETHSYRVGAAIPNEQNRHWLKSDTSEWVLKVLKGSVSHALDKKTDNLFVEPAIDLEDVTVP